MKYDRPVWQIMHECADAMPDVFRYDDVRSWFAEHYPDVNEATIRAHLIGLTEGGRAKHVQFAQRSPVFQRVARGEYAPIPLEDRGEDPHAPVPSTSHVKMSGNGVPQGRDRSAVIRHDLDDHDAELEQAPDVILLGSVGDRVNVPAPAKEVFREVDFQRSRLDAELRGSEWFILSAEHGLLAPNEWMSPDSRTLDDMDPEYRVVWAGWVVARLQSLVGSIDSMNVRVDAPDVFIGPLFADLQLAGAIVSSGPWKAPDAPRPARIITPLREDPVPSPAPDAESVVEPLEDIEPLATVASIETRPAAGAHLADVDLAVPARETDLLPQSPGLYGWIVDPIGARVLNRCLKLPVRAGLVFVGQVGGSDWRSRVDPVLNLRDHLERVQLGGRTRASTFRMTLATVLSEHLGMTSIEDPRLTEWMLEHLSISTWATADGEGLRELMQVVIKELDPPLNVDRLPATEYRERLHQMRGELA